MKSHFGIQMKASPWRETTMLAIVAAMIGLAAVSRTEAASNVVLWDTGSRFAAGADVENRAGWKVVPSELFSFEADPLKAASDPGYYGREYSFKGDTIVENRYFTVVFWSGKGRVVVYSKEGATASEAVSANGSRPSKMVAELVALPESSEPKKISRCEIIRNVADEVALEIFFSGKGSSEESAVFSFDKTEIVEIKPTGKMKGLRLLSTMDYGIAASFIGDDLVFDPSEYPSVNSLGIPSENLFLGLLKGEDRMLVVTWPKGNQRMKLGLASDQGKRVIESVDFSSDGQSLYLATLAAPGIWHREELMPSHLEKDVASQWKKPFAAKWKTQLSEAGLKTTFGFRESKGQIWRGVPGSYDYPVWFDGDDAFYHLSKKVPPKGVSLIYFLEGQDTPRSLSTPADILKATLGRQVSESILDPGGRKLRTHHRRAGDGVHRACTCGYTEAIQAVFEAGQEVAKKGDVQEAVSDMIYFVERHVARIDEYIQFAADLTKLLRAQASASPELKPYLDGLQEIAQQIQQEYDVQKENMKSLEHASELTRQTMALTLKSDSNNLKNYMELLKAWRAMGGAQDYVLAQCHAITRKLSQEAGYRAVDQPKAVALAQEIRAYCRQVLRNPDGYEIWANY